MTDQKLSGIGEKDQKQRFIDTAQKLGADDDEKAFKEKLGVIARQKLKPEPTSQAKRKDKAE